MILLFEATTKEESCDQTNMPIILQAVKLSAGYDIQFSFLVLAPTVPNSQSTRSKFSKYTFQILKLHAPNSQQRKHS